MVIALREAIALTSVARNVKRWRENLEGAWWGCTGGRPPSLDDAVAQRVLLSRRSFIRAHGIPLPGERDALKSGALVVTVPGRSLLDEAAWELSGGYFDKCDIPRPEYWVGWDEGALEEETLLSWVPSADIARVQLAVEPQFGIHEVHLTPFRRS
jgi:hypothetical protein